MLRSPSTHHHPRLNQGPGLGPGHHQMTPNSHHYSSSPASTCSDEDSDHSQPNDLSSKHSSSHYYGSGHHGTSGGYHGSGHHGTSPYVATNECRIIEYRGARIAAFLSSNRNPAEYLLCLPQAFELFLKHLVGGLHTVYTKLKRLDIVPIVCNVEQVRILRGLGAIQPGVNRCKLLSTKDFDVLFKDCTTASRPGRPPKRSPVAGMVSPVPTSLSVTVPSNASQPPYLGFPPSKKPRFADDLDFGRDSPDLKGHQGNNSASNANSGTSASSNVAAMLAANGYSAAFPFLHHLANSNPNSASQQQQLAAAAAALGLPGLPTSRFGNTSPTPTSNQSLSQSNGLTNVTSNGDRGDRNNSSATGGSSDTPNVTGGGGGDRGGSGGSTSSSGGNNDFNQTAAYLWLLSQQQQQQQHQSVAAAAAAAAALNLTGSRHSSSGHGHRSGDALASSTGPGGSSGTPNSINGATGHPTSNNGGGSHSPRDDLSDLKSKLAANSGNSNINNNNNNNNNSNSHGNGTSNSHPHVSNGGSNLRNVAGDESTDDEEDDIESHNSSHSDNPVSSTGFNGVPLIGPKGSRMSPSTLGRGIDRDSGGLGSLGGRGSDSPMAVESPAITGLYGPEQHCLETLLRNIKGLLAIATHNARQQQTQLHLAKEYQAEMATQIERERLAREAIEKQLNEEQKIRVLFQKRYKKERRFRRRLEQELHNQQMKKSSGSQFNSLSANCDRTTGDGGANDSISGARDSNNSTNNNSSSSNNNNNNNNNNSHVTNSMANASSPKASGPLSNTSMSITNTTSASATAASSSNVTNLFNPDDANEDSHDKGSLVPSSPAGEEEPDQPPSVEAAQIEATE